MPHEKILKIATLQRNLLTSFAFLILSTVLSIWTWAPALSGLRLPVIIVYFMIAAITGIYACLLANELRNNLVITVLVGLILFLVPIMNILMLLAINHLATRFLQENGVPVGFSGADINSLKRQFEMQDANGDSSVNASAPV